MANTNAETMTELERQAESRRAKLFETVDELHNRVSPGAIKADVRTYARSRMHSIEQQLRQNPLQTVAIAAGIAYPLWRTIGRIPAPLLMIGAGIAMSRRGSREAVGERYDDEWHDTDTQGATLSEKVSAAGAGLAEKASETIGDVRGIATEKVANLAESIADGYQSSREAVAGTATQTYNRTRDSVIDLLDRHPMVAGGLAFALGSLLASSLPVTPQENRLLGETSDDLKRRTQDLASEGLGQAKAAAQQIYEGAASQVREQGLTPDAAASTVHHAVETAREAVERTMEAAGGAQPSAGSFRSPRNH